MGTYSTDIFPGLEAVYLLRGKIKKITYTTEWWRFKPLSLF